MDVKDILFTPNLLMETKIHPFDPGGLGGVVVNSNDKVDEATLKRPMPNIIP